MHMAFPAELRKNWKKEKKLGGTSAHSYQPPARIPPVNDVADGNYRYCYDKRPQQVYHQSRQYHEDGNDYPVKRSQRPCHAKNDPASPMNICNEGYIEKFLTKYHHFLPAPCLMW